MMIAPKAEVNSGLIEYVSWGGDWKAGADEELATTLMMGRTFIIGWRSGRAVCRVEFDLNAPVDVMVDGEVLTAALRGLDVLPAALNVAA